MYMPIEGCHVSEIRSKSYWQYQYFVCGCSGIDFFPLLDKKIGSRYMVTVSILVKALKMLFMLN
jgi:hypothetical protein